jgi:dTDP-glucose 4,6-dehydratase
VKDDIRFVQGDVTDAEFLDELVADADAVVHFGAETYDDNGLADPDPFLHTNVAGTQQVLEPVRRDGTRMHPMSTDVVYSVLELWQAQRI